MGCGIAVNNMVQSDCLWRMKRTLLRVNQTLGTSHMYTGHACVNFFSLFSFCELHVYTCALPSILLGSKDPIKSVDTMPIFHCLKKFRKIPLEGELILTFLPV